MEIERRLPRLDRRVILAALFTLAIALPLVSWYLIGRDLPVHVTLRSPKYFIATDEQISLEAWSQSNRDNVRLAWQGLESKSSNEVVVFHAPKQSGLHDVSVTARRSASSANDSVTLHVLSKPLEKYPLVRPPVAVKYPHTLPLCSNSKLSHVSIEIMGLVCTQMNLVVGVSKKITGTDLWHGWTSGHPHAGRMVNLRVPSDRNPLQLQTTFVDRKNNCRRVVKTDVTRAKADQCTSTNKAGEVFADFSWKYVGPGQFSFAAQPPRTQKTRFDSYYWDFGDGTIRETKAPRTHHHYQTSRRQWVVQLIVKGPKAAAKTQRVVTDRSTLE